MRRPARFAALLAALAWPASARAEPGTHAEGRLDGDLGASVELGAEGGAGLGGVGQLRLLYVATAGAYASFDGAGSGLAARSASVGVELRPLFLPRFLRDMERGPAELDLIVDSVFFDLGGYFPRGDRAGFEFGTGFELPLLGRAEGPYLGARLYRRLGHDDLFGQGGSNETLVMVTIGFRALFASHVADAGDRVYR